MKNKFYPSDNKTMVWTSNKKLLEHQIRMWILAKGQREILNKRWRENALRVAIVFVILCGVVGLFWLIFF